MKILLLGAANNAGLVLTQILGSTDCVVDIAINQGDFAKAAYSRYIHRTFPIPAWDTSLQAILQTLIKENQTHHYDYMIPVNDNAVLFACNDDVKKALSPAVVCCMPQDIMEQANDKVYAANLWKRCGGNIPQTIATDQVFFENLLANAETMSYPVMIRTRSSKQKNNDKIIRGGNYIANNAQDFIHAIMALHSKIPYPFVQPLFYGPGWGVEGVAKNGRWLVCLAHRRLREANPSGSYASAVESIAIPPDVMAVTEKVLQELNWTGAIMFEIKYDQALCQHKLIEINTRLWGSLPLASHCGIDIPHALLYSFGAMGNYGNTIYTQGVKCRLWGDDLAHLGKVLLLRHTGKRQMYPSRWQSLFGVLCPWGQYSYNGWKGDWKPGLAELLHKILKHIFKK